MGLFDNSRREDISTSAVTLKTPQDQYERCMSDNDLTLENKRSKDITLDEIAEYRCKPFACQLQLCMSTGHRKPTHRNALTGEPIRTLGHCERQQDTFYSCIQREKRKLEERLKEGVAWSVIQAE